MTYGYIHSKDGEITGEQTVLRYSAFDTWLKSKSSYREKYYLGKSFTTPETVFGHEMHNFMETASKHRKHPILKNAPRYAVSEKDITVHLGAQSVKIGGRIDSFCPELCAMIDYKFGHRSKDGKAPWDTVKVHKHRQLVFYSILIEEKFKKVDRWPRLVWIETEFEKEQVEFDGHTLETDATRKLRLTGHVEVFKRLVTKEERNRMRKQIQEVAKEIAEDFNNYKNEHGPRTD